MGENEKVGGKTAQEYQVLTGRGAETSLETSSTEDEVSPSGEIKKHVIIGNGKKGRLLKEGKKNIVFRAPADKKIANLTMSFQIV